MNNEPTLTLILLGIIIAELTYLVVKSRQLPTLAKQTRPIFIDTSVLIDGRILAVARSGFISDRLVVPRSVVGELQYLADNGDTEKRNRARHGMDVIGELQKITAVKVEILQDGSRAEEGVDERLLSLAKRHNGAVCTIDYNLNKVAHVEGIEVLNVNELAQTLRMAYLPGERILLELVQKGQDNHQAVGYLKDGTMVVVEHAAKQIGQSIEVEFIRAIQTAAGKMMFAKRVDQQNQSQQKPAGTKPLQTKLSKQVVQPTNKLLNSQQAPQIKQSNVSKKQTEKKHRPRTSADNERRLLDLVDRQ